MGGACVVCMVCMVSMACVVCMVKRRSKTRRAEKEQPGGVMPILSESFHEVGLKQKKLSASGGSPPTPSHFHYQPKGVHCHQ